MNGNYYAIDIWGLIAALVMVAIAAGISETMRMGVGRTLLWSACRALLQLYFQRAEGYPFPALFAPVFKC